MLPASLLTVTMLFLVHHSISSPVYTMQPAYITANIGASTGRNIRRLPCVSRKSGMSGTCMFAIDCLKANGTHLGTCIDRFYFGSCCHIEPNNDLSSNVIDTAIMPDRQPPYRMSSTTEKVALPGNTTIPSKATTFTTVRPIDVTSATSTSKTITTMTRRPSPSIATTEKPVTTQKVPPTEAVKTPANTTRTTTTMMTTVTVASSTVKPTTTESFKLSTFQSVDDGTEATTTVKPRPSSIKVTAKPVPTKPRPRPTVKPTVVTTKATQKPVTKPIIKATTTKTPVTVKPTRPSSTTTVKTSTSGKPIKISSTQRPTVTVQKNTTLKPSTTKVTTVKPTSTTSKSTSVVAPTTKLPDSLTEETRPQTTTSVISNEVLLSSTKVPYVETPTGNTATNEIIEQPSVVVLTTTERPTTQGPGLVTWAMVNNNEQTTKATLANNSNEEADEWTPITPPDGWVLLPSVSTTTSQAMNDTPTTESPQTTTTTTINSDVTTQTSPPITTSSDSPNADNTTTATLELVPLMNTSSSANTEETTPGLPTEAAGSTVKPVNMSDHTDVCGRRMYPEPRIVGGEKSSFGKWPWQISLRQWKTSTYLHKCGAALLNENWAITAAHCVENVPPSDLLLRLGEHDLSTDSEPYIHQERRVQIVASHPQFDPRTFEYDLALLRFYEPVQFQPNIIPVCVPQDDESFVGRNAFVTGWGRLYEDGPLPSVLQEVSVPVINNTVCESMYRNAGYIEHIPNIFICAGWKHGGFDSCEGDSGGPMVIQRPDKRYLLAGIISWGIGCAEPNQPGVYTRISEFREWINQILQF